MSILDIIALSGVVYKIKSTDPSTEPRGAPYESVTLSDRVSLIYTDWCLFCKEEEKQILAWPDIPYMYQSESLSVNVAWSMVSKVADKSSKVRAVTSPLSILIKTSLCTFSRADSVE